MGKSCLIVLAAALGAGLTAPGFCGEVRLENLPGAEFKPGELKLPLEVTERSGVERSGAVVSSGVPFPPGFLPDVKRLRVVDAAGRPVASQASPMIKWHKPAYDDSVQWALVSFPADVAAGKTSTYYLLDDGKAEAPQAALKLAESPGAFTVETGPAKFVVPRKGKALVSEAFFGAEKVIGGEGLRAVVRSGAWPDRGLEAGSEHVGEVAEAAVEESGPVRVVLRLAGAFRPGDKEGRFYGFTARLYFAAGSPAVRVVFTMSNGRLDPELVGGKRHVYVWPVEDASLVADLAPGMTAARTVAEGKEVAKPLAEAELLVHQDSSGGEQWRELEAAVDPARGSLEGKRIRGVTFRGYKVSLGKEQLAAGNAHPGVIGVSGAKAGLAAALRNFRIEWPSALAASGKRLRAGLFPGEFAEPFHMVCGQRKSWDLRLALHGAKPPDLAALHAEAETLLLFRPLPAWMVRAAAAGAWPSGLGLVKDPRTDRPPRWDRSRLDGALTGWEWYGYGGKSWNSGGYHWNQNTCFSTWVLWGDGAGFDDNESRTFWAGERNAIHFDDPDVGAFYLMIRRPKAEQRFLDQNRIAELTYPGYYNRHSWSLQDSGHLAAFMFPEYYCLTGDMRAREAWENMGIVARAHLWGYNHKDRDGGAGPGTGAAKLVPYMCGRENMGWEFRKHDPDAEPDFMLANRYVGWPLYVLSQYYRLTGEPELIDEARTAALAFRNTGRLTPTGFLTLQINAKGDKGFYGHQGPFEALRDQSASQCYAHFQEGIMATGLVEYYLMSRDEEALDTLTGFADFICHHAMLRDPAGKRIGWTYCFGDYWGPYGTYDNSKHDHYAMKASWTVSNFRLTQPLGWIYTFTGRGDYLEVLGDAVGSLPRPPHFPVIAAHMAAAHPKVDREPPAAVADLAAEALGGGRVRLTWTAPGGDAGAGRAARYQVKYSTAPMVERVKGWPDRTPPLPAGRDEWVARAKAFNAGQRAFWAAFNVRGESQPGEAGAKQEMVVEKLPAGRVWLAIKSWDVSDNVSGLSNVVEVDVR